MTHVQRAVSRSGIRRRVLLAGAGVARGDQLLGRPHRRPGRAHRAQEGAASQGPARSRSIKTVPQPRATSRAGIAPPQKASRTPSSRAARRRCRLRGLRPGPVPHRAGAGREGRRARRAAGPHAGRAHLCRRARHPKNAPLAAQWYARGAELGDPEAMFAYGVMLAEGEGVDEGPGGGRRASSRRPPPASIRSPTTTWRCCS